MKLRTPLLLLLATLVLAASVPLATAHACSSSSSCGPCVDGEDHSHSDVRGACVSYARASSHSAGASAGADRDGAHAQAKFTPGAGAIGALVAVGIAGLLFARR